MLFSTNSMSSRILMAFFFLVFTFTCTPVSAQESEDDGVFKFEMPVRQLDVLKVALAQFKKDQPKANLERMNMAIYEYNDRYGIHFFPDREVVPIRSSGDFMVMTMPNPHGNEFGKSVTYVLSKSNYKILEVVYSK